MYKIETHQKEHQCSVCAQYGTSMFDCGTGVRKYLVLNGPRAVAGEQQLVWEARWGKQKRKKN
jgi:hypothetical protein